MGAVTPETPPDFSQLKIFILDDHEGVYIAAVSDDIKRVKELAKTARAIETTNPNAAARIRMQIEEIIATFKSKKIFRGAVAARVAPGAGEPPKMVSDAEISALIERDLHTALEHLAQQARLGQLWLMLYWNPELTPQENHENARRAIDGGWNPNDEVIP